MSTSHVVMAISASGEWAEQTACKVLLTPKSVILRNNYDVMRVRMHERSLENYSGVQKTERLAWVGSK